MVHNKVWRALGSHTSSLSENKVLEQRVYVDLAEACLVSYAGGRLTSLAYRTGRSDV